MRYQLFEIRHNGRRVLVASQDRLARLVDHADDQDAMRHQWVVMDTLREQEINREKFRAIEIQRQEQHRKNMFPVS